MRLSASKLPALAPGARVEGVELAVVGADEDGWCHRRRGVDRSRRSSAHAIWPVAATERVHAAVGRADVDPPVGDGRGGVERGRRQAAVAARGRARRQIWRRCARDRRVHVAVVGADVQAAVAVGGRGLDGAADVGAPADRPAGAERRAACRPRRRSRASRRRGAGRTRCGRAADASALAVRRRSAATRRLRARSRRRARVQRGASRAAARCGASSDACPSPG